MASMTDKLHAGSNTILSNTVIVAVVAISTAVLLLIMILVFWAICLCHRKRQKAKKVRTHSAITVFRNPFYVPTDEGVENGYNSDEIWSAD